MNPELACISTTLSSDVIGGLIGAVVGSSLTILGVILTNRANNQRLDIQLQHEIQIKQSELFRDRLEELYVESKKYLGSLVSYYLPYRMVMKGELTFNQALDQTIDSGKNSTTKPHRVTMIIDMYFPELKDEFNEVTNIRDHLNRIISGYKEQYKTGDTNGEKWLDLFQPKFEELGEKCAKFEEKVKDIDLKA